MKMKKTVALTLSMAMAFGMMACGSDNSAAGTAPEKTEGKAESQTETAKVENVEVNWFSDVAGWGPGGWNGAKIFSGSG